jgi:hypothetical protein
LSSKCARLDDELWTASVAFYKAKFYDMGFQSCWKYCKESIVSAFQQDVDQRLTEEPSIQRPKDM